MVAVVPAWALLAQVPSIAVLAPAGTLLEPVATVAAPSLALVEVAVPRPLLSVGRGWPPPA
jgi:hypothetical protein